ncbi:MAG: GGDEF domain-containing protein [Spirochaetales bacterium]|nr:GGDEF domain-containing protein [Spirochaetales bacterium]
MDRIEALSKKQLIKQSRQERFAENQRILMYAPLVISAVAFLYLLQYRFFPGRENQSPLFRYYVGLFSFAVLFSLLFRLCFPIILKLRRLNIKAVFFASYYYLMFLITVSLTTLDLQASSDYSAYAVGIFMVVYLYRIDWKRYIMFSLSGLIYFSAVYYLLKAEMLAPDRLLPLIIFTILSIYLVYVREKTRTQMLVLKVKLEDSALKDPLTGLYNRRYLFETLPLRISLFGRYGDKTALLLIDVDHFKKINDQFGHSAGDKVLKTLAVIIRDGIRETDSAYRYGGEEFLIVLNDTERDQAALMAERMRKTVEEYPFEGVPWNVTVCIGIAEIRPGDNDDHLIERADNNLYEAKRAGRNQVVK